MPTKEEQYNRINAISGLARSVFGLCVGGVPITAESDEGIRRLIVRSYEVAALFLKKIECSWLPLT